MFKLIALPCRWFARPFVVACALGLGTGCTTTSTAPGNPHLSGHWQLDSASSDDADAKISQAIEQAESKLRKRLADAGFSQYEQNNGSGGGHRGGRGSAGNGNAGGAELNGEEFSQTGYIGPDFVGLRRNLHQVLGSPQSLVIDVKPDNVRLAGDNTPPRDYPPDDEFTRIDEYGIARIDTNWTGPTFNLRARYSSKATVTERYTADDRIRTLTVMRHLIDPVVGKLAVRAVYRR
jgi:hypothetical protein